MLGKVDDQIEAFSGRHDQIVEEQRSGQESAIGADLDKGRRVNRLARWLAGFVRWHQSQVAEACVGTVDQAKAVLSGLDFEVRSGLAVDANIFAVQGVDSSHGLTVRRSC